MVVPTRICSIFSITMYDFSATSSQNAMPIYCAPSLFHYTMDKMRGDGDFE
jgi:hypothetical protein